MSFRHQVRIITIQIQSHFIIFNQFKSCQIYIITPTKALMSTSCVMKTRIMALNVLLYTLLSNDFRQCFLHSHISSFNFHGDLIRYHFFILYFKTLFFYSHKDYNCFRNILKYFIEDSNIVYLFI